MKLLIGSEILIKYNAIIAKGTMSDREKNSEKQSILYQRALPLGPTAIYIIYIITNMTYLYIFILSKSNSKRLSVFFLATENRDIDKKYSSTTFFNYLVIHSQLLFLISH
jgi:hypothetical protein